MEKFTTKVVRGQSSKFAYIITPFNAEEIFNIHDETIFVKGVINEVNYKGKLLSRWDGKQVLLLDEKTQEKLNLGDQNTEVKVVMELDGDVGVDEKAQVDLLDSDIDVLTAIRGRRSIRSFVDKDIDEEQINTLLQAGLCAPTAKNRRPYHFIVVRDRKKLKVLSETNKYAKMLSSAPMAIVVCGDKELEDRNEFLHADCAAATQNILLAAYGLKLGTTWCGVKEFHSWHEVLDRELNLPEKVTPFSVIAVGYPREHKYSYKSIYPEKIHYDKW